MKAPSGWQLVTQVFAGLLLILVIDTAFLIIFLFIGVLVFGGLGYHISIYK